MSFGLQVVKMCRPIYFDINNNTWHVIKTVNSDELRYVKAQNVREPPPPTVREGEQQKK
jgi:hypothetical protein